MRHAKSDWGNPALKDFDRPLNKRGKKAAPAIGDYLSKKNNIPNLIVTSPAKRARQTAKRFAAAAGLKNKIIEAPSLYMADGDILLKTINGLDNKQNSVMIVGHNPTMEETVFSLNGEYCRMPTAAICIFEADVASWTDFNNNNCRLTAYFTPKTI